VYERHLGGDKSLCPTRNPRFPRLQALLQHRSCPLSVELVLSSIDEARLLHWIGGWLHDLVLEDTTIENPFCSSFLYPSRNITLSDVLQISDYGCASRQDEWAEFRVLIISMRKLYKFSNYLKPSGPVTSGLLTCRITTSFG
jgi:hypothetical protein